jgi:hypothetical protein
MKTKTFLLMSKATLWWAFKVSIVAGVSIAVVAVLMTVTSNYASPYVVHKTGVSYFLNDCKTMLSDDEFEPKYNEISKKYFEDTKIKMSKELLDHYCLSSLQTSQLMKLFSFDGSRKEFATYAINKVYDPENFMICKNSFLFPANGTIIDNLVKSQEVSLEK